MALIGLIALSACGAEPAPTAVEARYQAELTVLEGGGHGPQLCDVVAESLPPQCGGPDVVGWDWSKVEHEARGGVKWGRYRVVGTWDGARLTLTEPARVAAAPAGPADDDDPFASPCPAPEGGWRAAEPRRATEAAMQQAMDRARTVPEFAGTWIDRLGAEPAGEEPFDGRRYVLNVRFTGDLGGREAWLREVWGGPLCVSGAERTEAELNAMQGEVEKELGGRFRTVSSDPMTNRLRVGVWVATEELRRQMEDKYGKGAVEIEGLLRPVP